MSALFHTGHPTHARGALRRTGLACPSFRASHTCARRTLPYLRICVSTSEIPFGFAPCSYGFSLHRPMPIRAPAWVLRDLHERIGSRIPCGTVLYRRTSLVFFKHLHDSVMLCHENRMESFSEIVTIDASWDSYLIILEHLVDIRMAIRAKPYDRRANLINANPSDIEVLGNI